MVQNGSGHAIPPFPSPTAQDSLILDFEWFANTSDYSFGDSGEPWYKDFGWNPQLFSAPAQQLKKYLEDRCQFVDSKSWL